MSITKLPLLICLLIVVVTLSVYWRVSGYDFVDFDDPHYVRDNPVVHQGLAVESLRWTFSNDFYASNWHPLTWLSHLIDIELYGLENPGGHHVTNLVWHLIGALLLFAALRRLTGANGASGFVALLFAVHPAHVESVAWIAARKDVLSVVFWMLTLWAYALYAQREGKKWYAVTLVAMGLGLMAKPTLVTLPFVLLLLDFWPLRRMAGESDEATKRGDDEVAAQASCFKPYAYLLIEKLPFFALSAASCLITISAQRAGGAVMALVDVPLGVRLSHAVVSYVLYLGKTFWPTKLAVFYPHPIMQGQEMWETWQIVGAAALLVLITLVVIALAVYGLRYLLVGWLWYLGTLVPVIGVVQVGSQAIADRYTYVPLIGVFIMLTWWGVDLARRWPRARAALFCIAGSAALACTLLTYQQVSHWRNSKTLLTHTINVTHNNWKMVSNLGKSLYHNKDTAGAIEQFRRAIEMYPQYTDAMIDIGSLLMNDGKTDDAVAMYRWALAVDPNLAITHYKLAHAMMKKGKPDEVIFHFRRYIEVEPAHYKPTFAQAHFFLGEQLYHVSRMADAVGYYERAIKLQPLLPHPKNGLAWIHATEPGFIDADKALKLARQANKLTGYKDPPLLDTLAVAYATAGRFDEAVEAGRGALNRIPLGRDDLPEKLRRQLEQLFGEINRHVELFEKRQPYRAPSRERKGGE